MPKDLSATLAEIESFDIDDKIRLVGAIWAGIEAQSGEVRLSPAQVRHLDRRIASYEANPDDVLTWEEARDTLAES